MNFVLGEFGFFHWIWVGFLVSAVSSSPSARSHANAHAMPVTSIRGHRATFGLARAMKRRLQMQNNNLGHRIRNPGTSKPVKRTSLLAAGAIVGLGSCGVDYIAQVSEFPSPDDKIRTTDFRVFGGGNAANTICGLAKLGNSAKLITKVGRDGNAEVIISQAKESDVDPTYILQSQETPSPFTYVIVDQKTKSRTCIHTAATHELTPEDIVDDMLSGCEWLHLDGRHTIAALKIAKMANERGITVSLDCEKEREHLDQLMQTADILFTNSKFPSIFAKKHRDSADEGSSSAAGSIEKDIQVILHQLPNLKQVVSTMGASGSVALVRADDRHSPSKLIKCPAWPISASEVVDSTGAGDAFIAGAIHALARHAKLEDAMRFGSYVAARKLTQLGAREGVPTAEIAMAEVPELHGGQRAAHDASG